MLTCQYFLWEGLSAIEILPSSCSQVNELQKELDKRHYMSQVYISNIETWKPTQLGLKTYGKWCDLVGWENLNEEKWTSTDDFMNLAVKRKWAEIYYSFEKKQNVCEPTKFGHDLFRTFEYWIDEKAQKKVARKKQNTKNRRICPI